MENGMTIDAGTISNTKPISIYSNDIINKITDINSKINKFKKDNTDKIDNGFNLSLTDIENKLNTIKYKVNIEIKPNDVAYSKALEDLYLIEYSNNILTKLISSFTVIKTIGE